MSEVKSEHQFLIIVGNALLYDRRLDRAGAGDGFTQLVLISMNSSTSTEVAVRCHPLSSTYTHECALTKLPRNKRH